MEPERDIGAYTSSAPTATFTLGDLLVAHLQKLGVEFVFGVPGGAIEPLYDALARNARAGGVRSIVARHEAEPGNLLPILIETNQTLGWLPPDVLRYVSARCQVPMAQILRVATFYNFFSLVPRGRHTINVCLGTGCFVKGGKSILTKLERKLGIRAGESTDDMRFSLEVVRCLGCCALGPAMVVDGEYRSNLNAKELAEIVSGAD